MLISENLIKFIEVDLTIQEIVGSQSFTLNKNQTLALRDKPRQSREMEKALALLVYASVYWAQLFIYWKSTPLVISLQGLLFSLAATVFCTTKLTQYYRRQSIIEHFNLFMQFENGQLKSNFEFSSCFVTNF